MPLHPDPNAPGAPGQTPGGDTDDERRFRIEQERIKQEQQDPKLHQVDPEIKKDLPKK